MAHELRLVRRIAAAAAEVYDAWTDPRSLAQWLIPMPGMTTSASLDVRVGGRLRIDMHAEGKNYPHHGEYLRLERPRLIEFTWISRATGGRRSVVTVELRALAAEETELTLTHRDPTSGDAAGAHRRGWSAALDHLAARGRRDAA
jgi:uncharacterized protein YndB with AHSA1/START domain